VEALGIAPDSRRAYLLCQGPGQAPELYRCDLCGGAARRLTHLNAAAEKLALGRSEIIRWPSSDGLEIEGQVVYPPGYRKGRAYPAILIIHGGPPGRFRSDLGLLPFQLLAAAGYLVLAPNPRGSSGYGEDFAKANFEDWGGGDYRDLMAGVDHLIEQGLADPKRLGVWGASYGGYMTAWVVSQTDRFRAAICQCGLTNLFSFNGQTDIPSFLQYYLGASPYDDPERFRARSALTFIRQVRTPTLFLHGEQDVRVPIAQSYEMYWGVRHMGVDTEFVIYPREGHGIGETPHQRDLYGRALEWFKQRLK
jgi:dipeptidyl aminopeptidase/acylaminoacyl peptidase